MDRWMQPKHPITFPRNKNHYGMPYNLFKDSDRDGVPNVFDCKPRNRRRQDVISPQSGGNPLMDMHFRQENARQQREYVKQLRDMQKLEQQKLDELQRIQGETRVVDNTQVSYFADPYIPDSSGKFVPLNSPQGRVAAANLKKFASTPSKWTSPAPTNYTPMKPSVSPKITPQSKPKPSIVGTIGKALAKAATFGNPTVSRSGR